MAERRVVMSLLWRKGVRGTSRFSVNLSHFLGCQVIFDRLAHISASPSKEQGKCRDGHRIEPPVAVSRPLERIKHGRTWYDPYHWMRVSKDEAVGYLQLENDYADKCMADSLHLQRKLEKEMAGRLKQEVSSPPERIGPWLYYTRIPKGQDYPVYCRIRHSVRINTTQSKWKKVAASVLGWDDQDEEEVLLDQNALVEQFGYVQLGTCRLSKDHNVMAYTLDTSGREVFSLFVKDLRTGRIMNEEQKDGVVSVEWSGDGRTLYYTEVDELLRPWRVYRRSLGSEAKDTLVFEEKDASSFLDVSRTKDWTFITVNVNSKTSSEVYLIDADNPEADLQLVEERRGGIQYFVEHHQGFLYILTNRRMDGGNTRTAVGDYRLVRCSLGNLSSKCWQEIASLEHGAFIEDMEIFEKHLVLYQRRGGLPRIQVLDLPSTGFESRRTLSLPQEVCTVIPGANEDFNSSVFRLTVSSPNLPETILEYHLETGKPEVLQQEEVQGVQLPLKKRKGTRRLSDEGHSNLAELDSQAQVDRKSKVVSGKEDCEATYDFQLCLLSQYECQRHEVITADGVAVPLTVVHGSGVRQDGQNPALLIGYGAYGKTLEVEWCSEHLSLLDRGWVIAFSHVRGGGELGRSWYEAGTLLKKKNSFHDFIASAKYLIENKYAHRSKLGALGLSAGGLLVASAVNLQPGLFRAVILQVPFLDINNTLLDKDLPLSVHEYDEWGDPDDPEHFTNIGSYSPYDNVQEGKSYPAMLVKTGLLDSRVGYWEAAKYVARVRDLTVQDPSKLILLKTSMDSGHVSDCGRFSHLKETAYDYAFLIKMIGR
ncbi:hypothetical protein Mapa_005814 [Marchantia paleacea]|nr:hypothetical protein Mapa_005814 [Marchantia paleacea]